MNPDLREDPFLVGREKELTMVVDQLRRGRHVLVVGERGIGKTRIMKEARALMENARLPHLTPEGGQGERRSNENLVYVWHCAPMGDMLKEICLRLYQRKELRMEGLGDIDVSDWSAVKKKLTGLGTLGVQNMVVQSLRSAPARYVLFFDSLDRVTVAHQQFLEKLLSVAVLCAGVTSLKRGFGKIWSSFSRIVLRPLSDEDAARLVHHLLDLYSIHLIDRRMYVRQVLKAANGNPFHLKNMLWHGSLERRLGEREIRELQRVEQGELLNLGPAYIFLASAFTLFKIFSMGTARDEFYVYFSALGFLVYLTFRVFRNFFLFRPQRFRE
jgi:hypothetical protein